jgi:DNA-binding IclR family transcriptional regulator
MTHNFKQLQDIELESPATEPLPAAGKKAKGIQSVEIGYRLLACFSTSTDPMSLKQIADASGMTSNKAYFYLTSFTRVGLVTREKNSTLYSLGPAALNLGLTALSQIDGLQKARDGIREIRSHPGQSAFISVLGSHGPTVVHRMQGAHWSVFEVRIGAILPKISATGRALLASLSPQLMFESIEADQETSDYGTPFRHIEKAEAVRLCEEVHLYGVAIGGGFVAPGAGSIAAPIFDHDKNVKAAITLVDTLGNIDMSPTGKDAKRLLALTNRISREMGAPEN